jgi:hypothetical protein
MNEAEQFELGRKTGETLALTRVLEVVTLVSTRFVEKWGQAEVMTREEAFAVGRLNGAARVQSALAALMRGDAVERCVEIALEEKEKACAAS